MVGGFLPVQQQAVVTVGEHYAGTAEHLRCFAVEGDVRGLEGPAGVKPNLLVQFAGDAYVNEIAFRVRAVTHPGLIGVFHGVPKFLYNVSSSSFM